ncbi:GAF and ANTAR domain-containing protein [Kribbella sp. NPDC006257]|uniref:GAF and ANTAR domain-containing protein n=1 Tax=Kribbella sp. NPDC006257 TaxID=3156738 RepID=UPI0033AFACD7
MTSHATPQAPLPDRAVRELAAATATLVTDHDILGTITNLLSGCADCVGAASAGIILATPDSGRPEFLAATDHRAQHLEVYQVQTDEGPGIDCTSTGQTVTVSGLAHIAARWPTVSDAFRAAGFDAVYAAPMNWQRRTLGAVNLFFDADHHPASDTAVLAQAFADMASLVIIQPADLPPTHVTAQTRAALDERTIIERAKGVIAYSDNLPMDAAFDRLIALAQQRNQSLTTTAAALIDKAAEGPIHQ